MVCCGLLCSWVGPVFGICGGLCCAGIGCGAGMGTAGYIFWEKLVLGAGCVEALLVEFGVG